MGDSARAFGRSERWPRDAKDRQILIPALHQNLIAETSYYDEAEHASIEFLSTAKVGYIDTEMIEAFELHAVNLANRGIAD
jgi:hypothetical protein